MTIRIHLFDYKITLNNPTGSCHLRILEGLCHEFEFTIFATEFDNPCPNRIRYVRIPAVKRPLALLFITYHLLAPLFAWRHPHADLTQLVESNLSFGTLSYAHFCHRAYLRNYWRDSGMRGLRGALRWLNHQLHAIIEPWIFRRVNEIVVPSQGLKREFERTYPFTRNKIHVIANPIDTRRMRPPADFDRDGYRSNLRVKPNDLLLVFVALGHFERKGLQVLLEALNKIGNAQVKLLVVGGEQDTLRGWKQRVKQLGLDDQVSFVGMQRDVRPYLWASDVFTLPSFYEVFPLVSLEAAAAGLPLLVTKLNGVEEFMRDGETGFVVDRSADSLTVAVKRFLTTPAAKRNQMGKNAREAVAKYSVDAFISSWHVHYTEISSQVKHP